MAKSDKGYHDFKGGEVPTGLGPGQDGFIGIPDKVSTFQKEAAGCTIQVGREETVGFDEVETAGRRNLPRR